jgi:ABC-type transporter Mla MlaB component
MDRILMEPPLELPETLTIGDDLRELQGQFLGLLNARRELALDGRPVTTIDTAGLQLLAVLCQDAAARGVGVRWYGTSPELAAGAELLGLTAVLGLGSLPRPDGTEKLGPAPQMAQQMTPEVSDAAASHP